MKQKQIQNQVVVTHASDHSTQEAKAGGSPSSTGTLQNKFQDSQDHTEKPCLKNKKSPKPNTNF